MGDSLPSQAQTAQAALLSAQAVMNAERPWVIVKVTRHIPKATDRIYFEFRAFNSGKSAARIVSSTGLQQEDCAIPESELRSPTYQDDPRWLEQQLPPGVSVPIDAISLFWASTDTQRRERCSAKEINIEDAKFVIYGLLRYYDGDSREKLRETRFCFVHRDETNMPWGATEPKGGKMEPGGATEYRRYT
jgi:hypothetical protein